MNLLQTFGCVKIRSYIFYATLEKGLAKRRCMKPSFFLLFLFLSQTSFSAEVNFIAQDLCTNKIVTSIGPSLDEGISPCSTFKIALSVIGYELLILKSEEEPVWPYDGSDVEFNFHKTPHSPKTWISCSVTWFSKRLARTIGEKNLQKYLSLFSYGNQDITGNAGKDDSFITAHLSSSLKISPREQMLFLTKLLLHQLPTSCHATETTTKLLPCCSLDGSWHLFGKSGAGFDKEKKFAWYVGWIEKKQHVVVFALLLKDLDTFPTVEDRQRIVAEFFRKERYM
jgi:beta-lactamase class D